jgi:hypothetical protein
MAAIAMLALVVIGIQAEQAGLHRRFQANTVNHRRVLSYFFLGMRIIANEEYAWMVTFAFLNGVSKIHREIRQHSMS